MDCDAAWENKPTITNPQLVSPQNKVWRPEIPYWWRVTTQIWVRLLICWGKFPSRHDQSEALPRFVWWRVICMKFRRTFQEGKSPGKEFVLEGTKLQYPQTQELLQCKIFTLLCSFSLTYTKNRIQYVVLHWPNCWFYMQRHVAELYPRKSTHLWASVLGTWVLSAILSGRKYSHC